MDLKIKAVLFSVSGLLATTALASTPSSVCLNMPAKITPLYTGGVVRYKDIPLCVDTRNWELQEDNTIRVKDAFVRLFGNGGFETNVAFHASGPGYRPYLRMKGIYDFNFTNLTSAWESTLAKLFAASLKSEGIVAVAVGPVPGLFLQLKGFHSIGLVRFNEGNMEYGNETRTTSLNALAWNADGKQYDILLQNDFGDIGYTIQ